MSGRYRRSLSENRRRREEYKMEKHLEKMEQFEEFQREILPDLQKMLKEGKSSEEIRKFANAYVTARMVTIALTDGDASKAIAAAKDILDRDEGKAKERTEHTHRFEKLKDEELDSLILSNLKEVEEDEETKPEH